jgi:RNA polymerase sigma-70 factor (ECF subfamily)
MGQPALELLPSLIHEHAASLELYAQQWCDTPQDVVQEAFLKFVRQERVPENAAAWLYRVVRNGAISAARSAGRRRRHELASAEMMQSWFEPWEGEAIDSQTATEALQLLPAEQREVIVAHIWGGLTFEQFAQVAECSSSTAYRRYAAGLVAIRERLGIECPTTRPANSK